MDIAERIRIGTSGYSFPDWKGAFYPETIKQSAMIEYYSRVFDVAEINFTYYRMPTARSFETLISRTDPAFGFFVKLHGDMTHGRTGEIKLFEDFASALAPLENSGRLLGLLAQFPSSFRRVPDNVSYLIWMRRFFDRFRFVVEFRHDSWLSPDVPGMLADNGINWCSVDEPQLPGLLPPEATATGGLGYIRFHGRNKEDWWRARPGSDRYLYDYSEPELEGWAQKALVLAAECETVFMFFNNCHFGNAPKNARTMKKLLGIPDVRPSLGGDLPL